MYRSKQMVLTLGLLAVSLCWSTAAHANWTKMKLKSGCKGMSFVDNSTGFLLRTTNLGQVKLHKIVAGEWDAGAAVAGLSFMFQKARLRFTDAQNGYLVGNEIKVYRTTDGGKSWTGVAVKLAGTTKPSFPLIHDIDFGTKTHGAVVGRSLNGGSFVAVTTDGGKTWNETTSKPPKASPYEVGMADSKTIVVGSYINLGKVFISHDLGATWSEKKIKGKAVIDIEFISKTTGFILSNALGAAVPDNEMILRTADGGKTWSSPSGGLIPVQPQSMAWVDVNNGYVGGRDAKNKTVGMARTTDGGKTWKLETMPSDPEYGQTNDITECLEYPGPTAYSGTANGKTWHLKNTSAGGKRAPRYGAAPTPDAGLPKDSGTPGKDSGTPGKDGGTPGKDGGTTANDGGTTVKDGAASTDSGTTDTGDDDEGCAVAGVRSTPLLLNLAVLALLGLRVRRRGA